MILDFHDKESTLFLLKVKDEDVKEVIRMKEYARKNYNSYSMFTAKDIITRLLKENNIKFELVEVKSIYYDGVTN